jgi:fatty acid amide hydrolase 2
MPNASGLVSRKGYVADEDAEVIKRLKQAGAIPFIITNVSELCMWYESANRLYGMTQCCIEYTSPGRDSNSQR